MFNVVRLSFLIAVLTCLDVLGAVALKEASLRNSPILAFVGIGAFMVLALLLYQTLQLSDLTIISLAWVVLYQLTVVGVDVVRYGVIPSRLRAAAMVVALLALVVAALAARPEEKHQTVPPADRIVIREDLRLLPLPRRHPPLIAPQIRWSNRPSLASSSRPANKDGASRRLGP